MWVALFVIALTAFVMLNVAAVIAGAEPAAAEREQAPARAEHNA
jgi:hypothetical protein